MKRQWQPFFAEELVRIFPRTVTFSLEKKASGMGIQDRVALQRRHPVDDQDHFFLRHSLACHATHEMGGWTHMPMHRASDTKKHSPVGQSVHRVRHQELSDHTTRII